MVRDLYRMGWGRPFTPFSGGMKVASSKVSSRLEITSALRNCLKEKPDSVEFEFCMNTNNLKHVVPEHSVTEDDIHDMSQTSLGDTLLEYIENPRLNLMPAFMAVSAGEPTVSRPLNQNKNKLKVTVDVSIEKRPGHHHSTGLMLTFIIPADKAVKNMPENILLKIEPINVRSDHREHRIDFLDCKFITDDSHELTFFQKLRNCFCCFNAATKTSHEIGTRYGTLD